MTVDIGFLSVDNPDLKKSLIALAGGNVVELDSVIFEFDNSYSWWTVSELNGNVMDSVRGCHEAMVPLSFSAKGQQIASEFYDQGILLKRSQ